MKKKICAMLFCCCVTAALLSANVLAAENRNTEHISVCNLENTTSFVFSDSKISVTEETDTGYKINNTNLTITSNGIYTISGNCSNGSIVVDKGLTDVTLILKDLTLTSSSTAPIVVKKSSIVSIHLEGTSALTDDENPENETSSDTTLADAFEGAVIKVKSKASVTFCGDGNLNIIANAKNGIKGGASTALIFNQSGTIDISGNGKYYGTTKSGAAINHGITCDGSIVFNQGNYIIKAASDGIKSTPDATDEAEGTTIDTDSAGTITVNGGNFDIDVDGDGFQADTALIINDGTFDIQTWKGYSEWNDTLADNYSCKGLKASGDRAEEAEISPAITISNGTFLLNTGDDAIHSDADITVTGGTFTIDTGDDGIHADTTLVLGTEGGFEQDPNVIIHHSYEGIESGTVSIYSGRYYLIASDDGINAAGGSSNGFNPGNGSGDNFRPGPGGGNHGGWNPGNGNSSSASDYNIYIYGGDIYVNCSGDGLDSNGGLYLYGGQLAVFSMASGGDNSALDADGTILIQGATIFTAGTKGVDGTAQNHWFGTDQKYSASSTSYRSGQIINTTAGNTENVFFSYTLPKNVNYMMASWPSSVSDSSPSFTTAESIVSCKGGSWSHNWNSGEVTKTAASDSTGIMTYTCTDCGRTETCTIPMIVNIDPCTHSAETEIPVDKGFTVTFDCDSGIERIDVYYTQDYTTADDIDVTSTVSRDSDTGKPDNSGSGQVNFRIWLNSGYNISSVTATNGTYKNIKTPDDTGVENMYRITKISNNTTVTITTTNDNGHEHHYGTKWSADEHHHWKECTCGEKAELADHTFKWVVDKEPTEDESGTKHEECTVCHATRSENTEIPVLKPAQKVVRIFGKDRYETAYKVADTYKEVLGIEKFDTVIVATGNNFADALSGSYLAAVKNAPILLTNGKAANVAELHAYIKANVTAGGTVYILGGTAAVPESVEAIKEAGYDVQRISGASRYETSLKILEEAGISGNELIVATGKNFADSLSASAAGRPILLVKSDEALSDAQKTMVSNFTKIYVIGGEGAVSKAIETELAAYGTVTRLSGADRYETSIKVAETFFEDTNRAIVASGTKFPDGLCGGPLAAAFNAPLVLTKDDDTAAAAGYIQGQEIQSGYVLGGTGAISEETVEAVFGFAETK